ncbi:GNAT family N-acetyltransferase [Paenibacillus sp. GCM10027627]|uniref:GNAT family N-acetyltransferase n=1 Tax=unclassified Paenibacillus TaxID=185978 RepID=UPI00362C9357
MKHQYSVVFDNVRLRPLEFDDLEQLRLWRNKDSIRVHFKDQRLIDTEQQKAWYERYLLNSTDIFFIIEETSTNSRPVGAVSLYRIDSANAKAEFGRFMIGEESAKGLGLGYKTIMGVCEFAFNELKLEQVYLEVLKTNVRAIHLYEKAGFIIQDSTENEELDLLYMVKRR